MLNKGHGLSAHGVDMTGDNMRVKKAQFSTGSTGFVFE